MGIRRDSSSPYHRLSIEQVRLDGVYLDVFKNKKEAEGRLRFWLEEFSLCAQQTSLARQQGRAFAMELKNVKGPVLVKRNVKHITAACKRWPIVYFIPMRICSLLTKAKA